MLLSLFRFTMVVLLVSAVCIEVNSEKLSFVPSEIDKAVAEVPPDGDAFEKEESAHDPEGTFVQKRQLKKSDEHSDRHESKKRSFNTMGSRVPRSGDKNLAQKLAKEALKSPKMQQTMNKLAHGTAPRKNLHATIKLAAPAKGHAKLTGEEKKHGKPVRFKGRKKKKRKRHHRRYRNQHDDGSKRGSSKRPLSTRRNVNVSARKLSGKENSISKRNQAVTDHKSRNKPSVSKSNEKITAVEVDDSDYIDFSSPLSAESTVRSTKSHKNEGSVKLHESENMVERLMRTTTKDPSKRNPGDQGIEYSDYYSEDDVLQDIAANKIPMGVVETGNPSERFARQTVNSTGFHADTQIDRNVQPCYQDYDARGKDFRYTDDSLDNFQNYPSIEHFSGLNRHSRLRGADEISYEPSYGLPGDGNANFDSAYPISTEEIAGPQMPEQVSEDFDIRDNLDESNSNNANNEIQPQYSDQLNYLNQYELPQEERLRYLGAGGSRYPNPNLDVEAQMENLRFQNGNPAVEVPQFSNDLDTPEVQNLYNYQAGTNLQRFDPSMANLQEVRNMMRPSSAKGENAESDPQSKSFPVQAKPNYQGSSNDVPSLSAGSAMDLPLGKVLESLGINVNTDSSDSNENFESEGKISSATPANDLAEESNPAPVSETLGRPAERLLSPSYLKKNPMAVSSPGNKRSDAKGSKSEALRLGNKDLNSKEGHIRRQSSQNGLQNDNLLPLTNDADAGHHVNISIAMHDTKEVASQILDTIMDELEELKFDHAKNSNREGLPCRLSGSWSTAQAGMKLDMKVANHSIIVTLSDLASSRFHESLLNGTWNVSGHAPFKRGSPFTLIATDNYTNSLAVFVGACRVCQGIDTIAGVWSVARQPKDCSDFQVATSVFNDIFRKTKLSSLREKQHTNTAENSAKSEKKRS